MWKGAKVHWQFTESNNRAFKSTQCVHVHKYVKLRMDAHHQKRIDQKSNSQRCGDVTPRHHRCATRPDMNTVVVKYFRTLK
jgi:hypothetical protein